jgi:predicted lipase
VIQSEIVAKQDQEYPYKAPSKSGAKMHSGFNAAYTSVRSDIHSYLNGRLNDASSVIVTGHSLGGAIATLCAVDIQYNFGDRLNQIELYTFGALKTGNRGFRDSFNTRVPNSYRFVNGLDIVPALPRPWQRYTHTDQEYRLGSRLSWRFLSKRFTDHDIKNYIQALQALQ